MHLLHAVHKVFGQLTATLVLLSDHQYTQQCKTLSHSTIGQHTRHIIEMFQCLINGFEEGVVNYEKRERDVNIETSRDVATSLLQGIYNMLQRENKSLILHAGYCDNTNEVVDLDTNFYREIAYNLEHAIHHMALIKVGVIEVSNISLPEGFGVASSTLKYRKACAQ
jgi:hypothetical protein